MGIGLDLSPPPPVATPKIEIRQRRAGGTFHVYYPATKQEIWPPTGTSWSQADARREGDRFLRKLAEADNPIRDTCPICKRIIGGEVIGCRCPSRDLAGQTMATLIETVRTSLAESEQRILNVAGTAQLDRLERKDLTFAREDIRTASVALKEIAERAKVLFSDQPLAAASQP
jgi:hypothetical protein